MKKKIIIVIFAILLSFSIFGMKLVYGFDQTDCNNSQIIRYSNSFLSSIMTPDWAANYVIVGISANRILYPDVFNNSNISTSSYLLSIFYNFSGPSNLTAQTTLTFILYQNSSIACNQMQLFHATNLVQLYGLNQLITPQAAATIASQQGFSLSQSSLLLIPSSESNSSYSFLVPGYVGRRNDSIVYINAINSRYYTEPLIHPLNNAPAANTSLITYFFSILIVIVVLILVYMINKKRREK